MRLRTLYAASHLFPSDILRHSRTWAGMAGLRHKPRHKDRVSPLPQRWVVNIGGASLARTEGTAARPRGLLGARRTKWAAVFTNRNPWTLIVSGPPCGATCPRAC